MSSFQPNKTDPLWFLDNHVDKKETQSTETGNVDSKSASDDEIFDLSYKEADAKLLEQLNQSDSKDSNSVKKIESVNENPVQAKVVQDTITLKSELENSIFDLAKRSLESGKTPEFRITISSNSDKQTPDNTRIINLDRFLQHNNARQNEQSENIDVAVNSEGNGPSVNDLSTDQFTTESQDSKATAETKPKTRVILKTNIFNNNNENIAALVSDRGEEICTEIGSSVINLNDYISPGGQPLTGNETISTSVNYPNNDDTQSQKVELVVTIKDERTKPVDESISESSYTNDMNIDFPSLDALLKEPSLLEEQLTRAAKRFQKLVSRPSSYNEPLQTSKPTKSKVESSEKWSSETKDSYVREDGARCYRTVTTTPQGRRVQTQCYNGNGNRRRGRRTSRWPLGGSSIWNDMEDDIDLMFSRANRLMFF